MANSQYTFDRYSMDSIIVSDFMSMLESLKYRLNDIFTIDGKARKLRINNISFEWPENYPSFKDQLQAKYTNSDYTAPVKASFDLLDENDKVIATQPDMIIMQIPIPTGRGTYLVNGKEFSIRRQFRLKPGIYTTMVDDGVQAFVNTSTRQNMKLHFEPRELKFTLEIGSRVFPLYGVMKAMGIPDSDLRKSWGDKVFNANVIQKTNLIESLVDRLYSTMYAYNKQSDLTYAQKCEAIEQAFAESDVDPWTTKITLGNSIDHISPELLVRVTDKMIGVNAGREQPDRRDALFFKSIYGIDDMVDFALNKFSKTLKRKLTNRIDNVDKDLTTIISRPLTQLDYIVKQRFNQSDLSFNPDQLNPINMLNSLTEVTLLGEGGISSTHSIPESSRELDDSYMGFVDPSETPSNQNVGVNLHTTINAIKSGKELKLSAIDIQTKKHTTISSTEAYDKYMALPEQIKSMEDFKDTTRKVKAIHRGEIIDVPISKIDYALPHAYGAASYGAATIPFINHNAPTRITIGVKQLGHVIPLKYREPPLVQNIVQYVDGRPLSANEMLYKMTNIRVPYGTNGVVEKITNDEIHIRDDKGNLKKISYYRNFPLNSLVELDSRPLVSVGDKVESGQVITENNFSKDGMLALGKNLKIAYMPWKGLNFMDGIVVSESAAKSLTSEHQHQKEFSVGAGDIISKNKFISHYPTLFTSGQLSKLDEDGIIKEGETINFGDPVTLKMSPRKLTEDDILRGKISSVFKAPLAKDEKTWDHQATGKVFKVVKNQDSIKIYVRTEEPLVQGDKLTGMFAQKGIVVSVIPDEEMPRDKDGNVFDIVQNPTVMMSRMNVGQVLETAASKIAKKTGKPYMVHAFRDNVTPESLQLELEQNGLSDQEEIFDSTGKPIGKVFTGWQYFYKLKQQAEKYYQARSRDDQYDVVSHRPIKGPKLGPLGFYALLSHGSHAMLKDMGGPKSEANDEWWRAFETGQPLPTPKTTFAFDKLVNFLHGAGIKVALDKDSLRLMPITDKDIAGMATQEVPDAGLAVKLGRPGDPDFMAPMPGGLYDNKVFGGLMGDKWGKIQLPEPIPNPMFEKAIKSILDLDQIDYEGLVDGTRGLIDGKMVRLDRKNAALAMTGPSAFSFLLGNLNRDAELIKLNSELKGARADKRDAIIKKIRYLNGLKLAGLKPTDYMISQIPVLPPVFRPVYLTKRGELRVSDLTSLYQDLGRVLGGAKDMDGLPRSVKAGLRNDVYDAVKAIYGIGDPVNYEKAGSRDRQGILAFLKGAESPTRGHFLQKIFSKRQALGGRAVIAADPSLPIDYVGLPDDMAWTIYKPFVMKRLVQAGVPALQAKKLIEDKSTMAANALDVEMSERPVMLTRHPILHKFNSLAFFPKRIPGDAIKLPPLVCKGFNADYDGDAMMVDIPVSSEAVKEAKTKMLPSQNLIQYGRDTVIMRPEEDTIAGLYSGTIMGDRTDKKFNTFDELIEANKSGEIGLNDGVFVGQIYTNAGRAIVNSYLPEEFRDYDATWGGPYISNILKKIAIDKPDAYVKALTGMKNSGDDMAYRKALSFKLSDLFTIDNSEELKDIARGGYIGVPDNIQAKIDEKIKAKASSGTFGIFANAGARGNWETIQQILYSPMFVADAKGVPVPHVIKNGYAKGLDYSDWWTANKGTRASLQQSAVEVSDPGYFGKQLTRATLGMVVQPGDDSDGEGIEYPVSHKTVLMRYLAKDVKTPNGDILAKAGDPITPELVVAAQKAKVTNFNVRSPLTSVAAQGLYAKDFGRLPENEKPEIGKDMGIISTHTITEPAVQLALRSFHGGGSARHVGVVKGLYTIWPILNGRAPQGMKAPLATQAGTVQTVTPLKSGGYDIVMSDGTVYTSPSRLKPLVNPGDSVLKGQQLQEGIADPKEVLQYRGLRELQNYLVDQIEDNFGSMAADRRYLETLVAAMTRYSKVVDPGEDGPYLPGDTVPSNEIMLLNKKRKEKGLDPIKYDPIFVGMDQFLPEVQPDWIVKMMGRDMIRQIQESASRGATSRLSGPNPIMPFLYNVSFGDYLENTGSY